LIKNLADLVGLIVGLMGLLGAMAAGIERIRGIKPNDEILKSLQIIKLRYELSQVRTPDVVAALAQVPEASHAHRPDAQLKVERNRYLVGSRLIAMIPSSLILFLLMFARNDKPDPHLIGIYQFVMSFVVVLFLTRTLIRYVKTDFIRYLLALFYGTFTMVISVAIAAGLAS
jgi:hypothetical protein